MLDIMRVFIFLMYFILLFLRYTVNVQIHIRIERVNRLSLCLSKLTYTYIILKLYHLSSQLSCKLELYFFLVFK